MNKILTYIFGALFLFFALFSLDQCSSTDDDIPSGTSDDPSTANYLFDRENQCIGKILEIFTDKDTTTHRGDIYFLESSTGYVAMVNKETQAYEIGLDGQYPTSIFKFGSNKVSDKIIVSSDVTDLIKRDGDHDGIFFRIQGTSTGYIDYYSDDTSIPSSSKDSTTRLFYTGDSSVSENAYKLTECDQSDAHDHCKITFDHPTVFNAHSQTSHWKRNPDVEAITGFPSLIQYDNQDKGLQVVEENIPFNCRPSDQ